MNILFRFIGGLLQFLIVVTILAGCSIKPESSIPSEGSRHDLTHNQQQTISQESKPMPLETPLEISPQDVKQKLDRKEDFVLIDCREQNEYDLVHIDHSRLVPMSELEQKAGELEDLKDKEIVVYCHHGRRSMMVTKWMLENGFTNVKSMAGGIDRWSEEIDSELQRY